MGSGHITTLQCFYYCFYNVVDPPKITTHPQDIKDAVRRKSAKFTVQATGTEPLKYNWQWKPDEKESGREQWQPCSAEWCNGTILLVPSVQKLNKESYRCVISNFADTQLSEAAQLNVGRFIGLSQNRISACVFLLAI